MYLEIINLILYLPIRGKAHEQLVMRDPMIYLVLDSVELLNDTLWFDRTLACQCIGYNSLIL